MVRSPGVRVAVLEEQAEPPVARAGDGPGWEVELARPSGGKPGALRVILPEG